jgi:hypothetical protein
MKPDEVIVIKPLTKKMKDKIKQFGNIWRISNLSDDPNKIMIETMGIVHCGKYPYSRWVIIGVDIEIVENIAQS